MTTKFKSNNIDVKPEFEELFSFGTKDAELQHKAEAISFRILSEVERICDERNIKRAALASSVGTSKSYITQLFSGAKQVNTMIMAKFEDALNVTFYFKATAFADEKIDTPNMDKEKLTKVIGNKGLTWYRCMNAKREVKTSQFIERMVVDHDVKQVS